MLTVSSRLSGYVDLLIQKIWSRSYFTTVELLSLVFQIFRNGLAILTMQGKLKGFDVRTNLILADSVEREYSADAGVEMVPLGLYMIKGDNV